ncbi:WxL domain-containing protein [Lacticaseibacillus absianus]|uniref:WxL domain-containing protein n=1 Tax=Lacticaseibacillus absianus TaxID=2729623 RepID=UPI0015CB39E6|nr:WxL domain-containing protein [Lacticaseibacillus absianus]
MRRSSWLGLIGGVLIGVAGGVPVVAATGPGNAGENIAAAVVGAGFTVSEAGDADAASDATVELSAGALTLDAVPNFHFATKPVADIITGRALTLALGDGPRTAANYDGNDDGVAVVTDYRGTNGGWTLSAEAAAFERVGGDVSDTLYFSAFPITGKATGDNIGALTSGAELLDGGPVMAAAPGFGTGTTTWRLDSATVELLQSVAAKAGQYRSTIQWRLSTTPQP